MSDKLRISAEEREKIVRGFREEFPKYTTQLLNLANQNAQSTRPEYVGKMKDIIKEFESDIPEGEYDDWVEFYTSEYEGDEKLNESADRLYEMVQNMREAMDRIDEDMAERYVKQLVLYKTYIGKNADIDEVIFKKLEQVYSTEVERTPESWMAGYVEDIPVVFQSLDSQFEENQNAVIIYYRVESDNSIIIDPHELDETLGTTITEDDTAHRSLSNFSFSLI